MDRLSLLIFVLIENQLQDWWVEFSGGDYKEARGVKRLEKASGRRLKYVWLSACTNVFRPLTGMYDFCYWMTTTPNNSTDSAKLCAQDGGTVAWVNSAEAQAFVEKTYGGNMPGGSQFYIGVTDPVSEDYRTYAGEEQYYFNWDVVYTPMADWTCVIINYDNFKWRETKCFFPKLALCSKTIQREYLSSYFDRVHVGKTLSGHEVSVLDNVTFIRCAFACQMNVRCKSINHDVSSRRCAINSGTAEAYPAQLTTAPNSNYYTVFI